ncbi:MAG: hypothetical protein IPJ85_09870 [Flavobacteriales bacterium]|nr:hypothetical protein [Flavobacteriales bacterium]
MKNTLNFTRTCFGIATLLCLLAANGVSAQLFTQAFTGASSCPTPGNTAIPLSGATVSAFTRNTITCTAAGNVLNSTTLNVTASRNDNSYIEFNITADGSRALNLTSLSFFRQASATAPNSLIVSYSTDPVPANFNSTRVDMAVSTNPTSGTTLTWTFPSPIITGLGGMVTFRFYPFGTTRADGGSPAVATGTFRLDDAALSARSRPQSW